MSSESDDAPLSSLAKKTSPLRKRKQVSYTAESDAEEEFQGEAEEEDEEEEGGGEEESSDEDDVPLASLKKASPAKAKPKPKAKTPSSSASKKKAKTTSSGSKEKSTEKVKLSDNYSSASAALYESDCKKGQLIQKLLCRWWYATVWPDPTNIPGKPPKHYDLLDGFPGVFVCTSGEKVGTILDMRNHELRPSFDNYAKKSSKELQNMLLKALEEQKRQLVEAEGSGTVTEKELDQEIKKVLRMSPDAADKEAEKVLRAAKMKIV